MQFETKEVRKDLVVVGAGMPGLVAAIQAARLGVTVAVICDRGYLGGNASAEIRVPVSGADGEQELNFYSREGGILEEIRLENLYRNPQGNPYLWDTVLRDFMYREKNIELFMETNIDHVEMKSGSEIAWVEGSQEDSETKFRFHGERFIDDTGDGTIGAMAGAEHRVGREAKEEYGERIAPDRPDGYVLPSTLTFAAKDVGKPVRYIPPDFALDLTKTDILKHRSIPKNLFHRSMWYYEVSGSLDQVKDVREIVERHHALVYGIWDYIKNSGEYDSENYDLEYVSCIPGKRESRRMMGDYVLKEKDVVDQAEFEDAVGHGGWAIDLHAIEGFFDTAPKNHWIYLKGIYEIPYRTSYSRNIDNLFFVGRCMSTTHVAFGTTRVMATLCTLAQAVGAAAWLCKEHGLSPRGVYETKMKELQQLLLRDDQYIPRLKNEDPEDRALGARITASSTGVCAIDHSDGSIRGRWEMALIFPVAERMDSVSLLVRSDEETELEYRVYHPDKRYNYSCDREVASGKVTVSASREMGWIDIPMGTEIDRDKLFLHLQPNEKVQYGVSKSFLPGVLSLARLPNEQDRILDISTLQQKTHLWKLFDSVAGGLPARVAHDVAEPYSLCFRLKPEQDVFGPENINNGYARPQGLPNVWVSDGLKDAQWVEIAFDGTQPVERVILTLDPNLSYAIWNVRFEKEFNVMTTLVKHYRVLYNDGGKWKKAAEVRDNHQKVNRLSFDRIETDKLRIEFLETNGCPDVRLYEVRVY